MPPPNRLPKEKDPSDLAFSAYSTVYIYFWFSFAIILLCSMAFLQLVRKQRKADVFDYASMSIRAVCCFICLVLFGLGFSATNETASNLILGPYIVPVIVFMFFGILSVDQLSRIYANRQLKQMGLYPDDDAAEHGHGHEHNHDHGPALENNTRMTGEKDGALVSVQTDGSSA
jgi:hypothetical protein